jgi:hypothetical protein
MMYYTWYNSLGKNLSFMRLREDWIVRSNAVGPTVCEVDTKCYFIEGRLDCPFKRRAAGSSVGWRAFQMVQEVKHKSLR